MLPRNQPDRIRIVFDDHRLVANAGLLLPATLARHLGLRELVDHHLDLGGAPGRANTGDKLMTLVASAMAGGDCIDDADVLRTGGTACTLGGTVKAPSTLGTFLRSFRWGHVRQLDRVSRELLARASAAGAGPGDAPFTIDLDSTIMRDLRTGQGGRPPPRLYRQAGLPPHCWPSPPGTGDVLMSRLREGRANTARGAAHFLRETVGRVRYAGANGRLTLRADSGFYTHGVVSVCRKMDVRFSITIRQHKSLHNLIEAIPEDAWTPIPYWMDGAADVAETTCTPFQSEPDAAPVRLIVRRVKPTPGSQLALFATYSYHGFITDRDGEMLELEGRPSPPRRDRECHPRPQARCGVEPSPLGPLRRQRRLAGGTGDGPQHRPLDSAHRSGRAGGDHQDPPAAVLLPGRTDHPLGAPPHTASATALALGSPVRSCPGPIARPATSLPDGGGGNRPPSGQPNVPANSRQSGLRVPLAVSSPRYLALTNIRRRSQSLPAATEDKHPAPLYPKSCPDHRPPLPLSPVPLLHSHPFGGFGLRPKAHSRHSGESRNPEPEQKATPLVLSPWKDGPRISRPKTKT